MTDPTGSSTWIRFHTTHVPPAPIKKVRTPVYGPGALPPEDQRGEASSTRTLQARERFKMK